VKSVFIVLNYMDCDNTKRVPSAQPFVHKAQVSDWFKNNPLSSYALCPRLSEPAHWRALYA
jgi:hypothetical protein